MKSSTLESDSRSWHTNCFAPSHEGSWPNADLYCSSWLTLTVSTQQEQFDTHSIRRWRRRNAAENLKSNSCNGCKESHLPSLNKQKLTKIWGKKGGTLWSKTQSSLKCSTWWSTAFLRQQCTDDFKKSCIYGLPQSFWHHVEHSWYWFSIWWLLHSALGSAEVSF